MSKSQNRLLVHINDKFFDNSSFDVRAILQRYMFYTNVDPQKLIKR